MKARSEKTAILSAMEKRIARLNKNQIGWYYDGASNPCPLTDKGLTALETGVNLFLSHFCADYSPRLSKERGGF